MISPNQTTVLSVEINDLLLSLTLTPLSQIWHVSWLMLCLCSSTVFIWVCMPTVNLDFFNRLLASSLRHYLVSCVSRAQYCNLIGRTRFLALPYKYKIYTNLSRPSFFPKEWEESGARLLLHPACSSCPSFFSFSSFSPSLLCSVIFITVYVHLIRCVVLFIIKTSL